jgi:hypothetical protein
VTSVCCVQRFGEEDGRKRRRRKTEESDGRNTVTSTSTSAYDAMRKEVRGDDGRHGEQSWVGATLESGGGSQSLSERA